MAKPPIQYTVQRVSLHSIRKAFNKSQYPKLIKAKKLVPKYIRNKHLPHPELKKEPRCTYSQYIRYLDEKGKWQVEVHQYFRSKDNTIGGKGKPDPKRLKINNKILIADKRLK